MIFKDNYFLSLVDIMQQLLLLSQGFSLADDLFIKAWQKVSASLPDKNLSSRQHLFDFTSCYI
jgi:hypothetical protein